jgi:hypothetical protein
MSAPYRTLIFIYYLGNCNALHACGPYKDDKYEPKDKTCYIYAPLGLYFYGYADWNFNLVPMISLTGR